MKKHLIIAGTGSFFLLLLFFVINPGRVPAFILVLPFILLFVVTLSLALYFFEFKKSMEHAKSVRLAALCSALPILLLVLQSIGQLTLRDVITMTILFVLSYFYIVRSAVSS